MLNGETHIAVHSAKDLPSTLPEDLEIIAFTEREEIHDVLVSEKEIDITQPLVVGTSSTRRVALLKHFYPHFSVVPMRGNLQTRISKMQKGDCEALMLAYAGVYRMGYGEMIQHEFKTDIITPPVGQGALALEASVHLDSDIKEKIIQACSDRESEFCLKTERAFLRVMDGGCSVPIFASSSIEDGKVTLHGGIISLNGQEKLNVSGTSSFEESEVLGQNLANELLKKGGSHILKEIRKELNQ